MDVRLDCASEHAIYSIEAIVFVQEGYFPVRRSRICLQILRWPQEQRWVPCVSLFWGVNYKIQVFDEITICNHNSGVRIRWGSRCIGRSLTFARLSLCLASLAFANWAWAEHCESTYSALMVFIHVRAIFCASSNTVPRWASGTLWYSTKLLENIWAADLFHSHRGGPSRYNWKVVGVHDLHPGFSFFALSKRFDSSAETRVWK